MKTRDAVLRLMQEINMFADISTAYSPSQSVKDAVILLQHEFGIKSEEKYGYPKNEEAPQI